MTSAAILPAVKWATFFGAVLVAAVLGRGLRGSPRLQLVLWAILGFLPFFQQPGMGMVSDAIHPGDTHGLEVALIDLVAVMLFLAKGRPHRRVPYRILVLAYVGVAALSITQATLAETAFYHVWKLLRMVFLFVVIVRGAEEPKVAPTVLHGMMWGVVYQLVLAVWQRYAVGMHQVTGSFDHQNSLGVALNLVLMVPLALVFSKRVTWLTAFAPVAGIVTIVLTLSRGAMLFFCTGFVVVFLLSLLRGRPLRKVGLAALVILVVASVFAKAGARIVSRFEDAPPESMKVREQFKDAASLMLDEHPLGVGVNQFAWVMRHRGYGERAGVDEYNLNSIVHDVYWLTAAEMGYLGLGIFLVLLLAPVGAGLWCSLRARGDVRGDVLLGLSVGLGVCYLHGTVEWVWRTTGVSYVFWSVLGLLVALTRECRQVLPGERSTSRRASGKE